MGTIFTRYGLSFKGIQLNYYYQDGVQVVPFIANNVLGTDGSVVFEESFVVISAGFTGSASGNHERSISTENDVDLTNIDTLFIDWFGETTGTTSQTTNFIVGTSSSAGFGTFSARTQVATSTFASTGRTVASLNVSGLSGNFFIRVHQRDSHNPTTSGGRVTVYRIWGV
jgi:hypothetical protein